jgi:hypothetical protein
MELDRYHLWEYEDIVLFVSKTLVLPNPLSIVVSSFLGIRKLAIEGWRLI